MLTSGRRRHDNLAQLYRRKVELKLNGIGQAEARTILREYNVSDDAADALATIAADVKHGGHGHPSWKSWTSVWKPPRAGRSPATSWQAPEIQN